MKCFLKNTPILGCECTFVVVVHQSVLNALSQDHTLEYLARTSKNLAAQLQRLKTRSIVCVGLQKTLSLVQVVQARLSEARDVITCGAKAAGIIFAGFVEVKATNAWHTNAINKVHGLHVLLKNVKIQDALSLMKYFYFTR